MNQEEQSQTQAGNEPISQDFVLLLTIRQYFMLLRQEKGHHPDASPLDLEILLIIKFVCSVNDNPIKMLSSVGIIIIGDKIAINNSLLHDVLMSSRSRINNTLNKLKWHVIPMGNPEKFDILRPLLDRNDVRNWTIREIPQTAQLYSFVQNYPQVQFYDGEKQLILSTVSNENKEILNQTDESTINVSLDSEK
ncbi:hypothetical protein GPJ56_001274 [Histomonas meleagridis]|uniref:uncharacterized protein n=1 Tax=Histomonas meleagridis TaxID=135588 RepID=UPI003559FD96|nr:hypothetical protein GPJ56_001274 [Histomonas meleagridis]KAH0805031.1 hypothetical protein GO595_001976 [Histomonas meleagridis]